MIEVQAPNSYEELPGAPMIFLAGSIEMGVAEKWQDRVVKELSDVDCLILNPRRDDFDPSMKQEASDPYFSKQVNWELDGLDHADILIFYFDPDTKSPITLMELGMQAGADNFRPVIVCCPEGFWRRGNVQIVCERNGITMVNTFDEMIAALKAEL